MTSAAHETMLGRFGRSEQRPWGRVVVAAVSVLAILWSAEAGLIEPAPTRVVVPLADWLGVFLTWFSDTFRFLFRTMSALMAGPVGLFRIALQWLPWPSLVLASVTIGYLAGGIRLALFCGFAILYIVVTGLWAPTAVTLALIAVAVPLSAIVALLLGIAGFRWPGLWRLLQVLLDLMQTIPTLAYLLPIVVLFGIGPMVAVAASAIYAIPPMVRAVVHGLQRVPPEIVESGLMSGSNRNQLLAWVLVPSAMPTILLGLNQTIMAGLSMVVIASMVGGASDIGIEVYQAMKQAEFGRSITAGLVIAVLAMTMDRVSQGFAERSGRRSTGVHASVVLALVAAVVVSLVAAWAIPELRTYPDDWVLRLTPLLDAALDWFTVVAYPVTSALKVYISYFVVLPLKTGLPHAMRPNIWGIEMSAGVAYGYASMIGAGCLLLLVARHWALALWLGVLGIYYYFGMVSTPWLLTVAVLTAAGWCAGGWRVALVALFSMLFILLTGSWEQAMISLELTAVGVGISVLAGTAIGIWAALNDRVSAFVRPICDTLQTMPIFVFLIPAVMIFLVGEFTGLVAIVLYAIVPPIRYGELGIRNIPADLIEAARMMGVTRRQMLWQVQLPVALPEIALGVNQTVMMALAMVVVASLVGAPGLGQDVLIPLSEGDAGGGLVAGLSIAALAIMFDRLIQSWSTAKKRALGLH